MRTVVINDKSDLLHVETPLGVVNIKTGLLDTKGRRVVSIEVIPSKYSGEKKIRRSGYGNTRLIECLKAVNRGL